MRLQGAPLAWALAVTAACALAGCDEGSDSENGVTMHRDLEWVSAGDVRIEGMEYLGMAEVESMSDSHARVHSERVVLGALGERTLTATIHPVGFSPGQDRGLAFAVFTRPSPDAEWELFSHTIELEDGTEQEARSFRSILINRGMHSMELEVFLPTDEGLWRDHFARVVYFGPETEVALGPAPLTDWSDLEGMWEYELDVRCNGAAC
jgi:hypothetical protein